MIRSPAGSLCSQRREIIRAESSYLPSCGCRLDGSTLAEPQLLHCHDPLALLEWCPVTGQGAVGTNWSIGSSVWTWGRTSSLWGWRSTGTGCPGRLWSLLLWRYSRPAWTRSCAACSGWPCFGVRVGLDDPQRSLPTSSVLWFRGFRRDMANRQVSGTQNPVLTNIKQYTLKEIFELLVCVSEF